MNSDIVVAFSTTANVLVFIFGVLSILLIIYELFGIFRLYGNRKRKSILRNKSYTELLAELKQAKLSNEKASIFVSLILTGYVLNHIIVNAGGKYDDDKQQRRFKLFLTPTAVKKLNSMDGITL